MSEGQVVKASFSDFAAFVRALEALHAAGVRDFRVYSPVGLEEYEHLLPTQGSPVRWIALAAGVVGCALGFWLCIGSAHRYDLIVGGKAVVAWVPYCVIGFELTILTGALVTLGVVSVFSRLFPRAPAAEYDPAFSSDEFGLHIPCAETEARSVTELLQSAGAKEVRGT